MIPFSPQWRKANGENIVLLDEIERAEIKECKLRPDGEFDFTNEVLVAFQNDDCTNLYIKIVRYNGEYYTGYSLSGQTHSWGSYLTPSRRFGRKDKNLRIAIINELNHIINHKGNIDNLHEYCRAAIRRLKNKQIEIEW